MQRQAGSHKSLALRELLARELNLEFQSGTKKVRCSTNAFVYGGLSNAISPYEMAVFIGLSLLHRKTALAAREPQGQ